MRRHSIVTIRKRLYIRELQVTYRPIRKPKNSVLLQQLQNSAQVFDAFRFLTQHPKEVFVAVLLDNKNRVLGYETVSVGTETYAPVNATCAFRAAILLGAISVMFLHNHPSGDPEPSTEDRELYARLKSVGELIDVRLLDFLILGSNTFVSLAHPNRQQS